jgi:endoglucanase
VKRPKEGDTVSEGQAYAMLRAVWMDDKEAFDRSYRWAEKNLSRKEKFGDNLLAWHWKDGAVSDWMPASDADVDYALSLIFAHAKWKIAPAGAEAYGGKAKAVLEDILRLETYRTGSGRIYLSPWILKEGGGSENFPVNPSYYSPAHFKIFHKFSGAGTWLELADTSYYVLVSLSKSFNGEKGAGLIPDWCRVDNKDEFYPLEGKNGGFGWEAVRIPFRVAMDRFWFSDGRAQAVCGAISGFAENEWKKNGRVFCEYYYDGSPKAQYENSLFYSAYASAFLAAGLPGESALTAKARSYLEAEGADWFYQSTDEYYVNSLAWFLDGFVSGTIRDLL